MKTITIEHEVDKILSSFMLWDKCGNTDCQHFLNYNESKQELVKLIARAGLDELTDFRKNWHTLLRMEVHQDLNGRIAELEKELQ